MSWQATSWVIENSKHKGSCLLVMMIIANCANESGQDCWPGIARLAKDTRMSQRQLIRIIERLETSGELAVKHSSGRFPNHYGFPLMNPDILDANPDKMSVLQPTPTLTQLCPPNTDISGLNTDTAMSTDPSLERSKNGQHTASAPAVSSSTKRIASRPARLKSLDRGGRTRGTLSMTPLPDPFTPGEETFARAVRDCPDVNLKLMHRSFCAKQKSQARVSADWDSDWYGYMVSCQDGINRREQGHSARQNSDGTERPAPPYDGLKANGFGPPYEYDDWSNSEQWVWCKANNVDLRVFR
jgi:hypothetical protein